MSSRLCPTLCILLHHLRRSPVFANHRSARCDLQQFLQQKECFWFFDFVYASRACILLLRSGLGLLQGHVQQSTCILQTTKFAHLLHLLVFFPSASFHASTQLCCGRLVCCVL